MRISPIFIRKKSFLLFLLETGALASYLWNRLGYDRLTEKEIPFYLLAVTLAGTMTLVGLILYRILTLYARFIARRTELDQKTVKRSLVITLSPFLFLFLTFLEHFLYLKDIQGAVLLVSVCGTAYLQYSYWERSIKNLARKPVSALNREDTLGFALHSTKISRAVLTLSICIYILYASGIILPAHSITGDEPHYLLITKSLISDGDINLFNNYRDKEYLQYYPGELESHAHPGKKGRGYEYSKHSPGLPVLLAPSFFIGEKLGGIVSDLTRKPNHRQHTLVFLLRVTMGVVAALLCWVFFLFARDFTGSQKVALLSWVIFTLTAPLVFYSHLIYPEIPASLLTIAILYRVLSSKRLHSFAFLWIGFGIALFPWLGAKYILLCLGLFGIVVFRIWKSRRKRGNDIALLMMPLILSAGFYLFYLWSLYGTFWPTAIYTGYLPQGPRLSLKIFHFKISEFFRCGLSYLFDQTVGIFPYSPIYMIFFPGIILSIKRRKRQALYLLGVFLLHWGSCAWAYYWWGYIPPGRALLPVVFIMALFMAGSLAWGKNRCSVSLSRILLFMSFGIAFLCTKYPELLYHEFLSHYTNLSPAFSKLMTSLSNSLINFRLFVPSLIKKTQILWAPLILWLMGFFCVCLLYLKKEKTALYTNERLRKPIIAVFTMSTLFIVYTFFDIHLGQANFYTNRPYELYFQDNNNFGQELQGFWTKGRKSSEVLVKTPIRASEIRVRLLSPAEGEATVRVGREKRSIPRGRIEGQEKALHFTSPVGFPWKGGHIYNIRVKEKRGFVPYQRDPEVQDNRFLGVFVDIAVTLEKKPRLKRTQE
jgi:hypothetical protein